MAKNAIVIGSGFAGLSAASFLAKAGWDVIVLEKHDSPGGRARQLKESGFTFDRGPSWYWMPDIFERYFHQFGKQTSDYYSLKRLDPSYRIYKNDGSMDIPADFTELKKLFESIEPGSSKQLEKFISEAAFKYKTAMDKFVFKPGQSIAEFLDPDIMKALFRLDLFNSVKTHVRKYFKNPRIRELLEFPVLFLGAMPDQIPSLYTLMNYADIVGGTWYPAGGIFSVVDAMYQLAIELGVKFLFSENVTSIKSSSSYIQKIITDKNEYEAEVVIGTADYHFIENNLLEENDRTYSEKYWDKRMMAPSCLLYYVGLNKKLKNISHHSLFFDTSFDQHALEIYKQPGWPSDPLFYVSASSVSDDSVAPEGCENLFFLVPVAAGLSGDSESMREKYFRMIIARMEKHTNQNIEGAIIYKKSFAQTDFIQEYNAYKGNAYGLANTLLQTAILKPSSRSKKLYNLFYAGQLTVPGPGVPPALISGEIAANEALKLFQ
ncbi:MAG: phytoene desaturase [Bacteroidetes bacterium]|nr:phytoene desaturase [Bacteroidota bacterium]